MIAYAFAPEKLQGWKWLATVVLVYSILFCAAGHGGHRRQDRRRAGEGGRQCPVWRRVVRQSHEQVGNTLTEVFETAFQVIPGPGALPSELAYQKHGLMFGNRLIRETRNVVFRDPKFRDRPGEFHPQLHDVRPDRWDDRSRDFRTQRRRLGSDGEPQSCAILDDHRAAGPSTFGPATSVYTNLGGRLPAQLTSIQGSLAVQLNPTLPGTAAAAVIAGQIQQAYLKNQLATRGGNRRRTSSARTR